MQLALFDLDHTLLSGDSDELWCNFMLAQGLLPAAHAACNVQMVADYRAGTVSVADFCNFYVGQLAGRSPAFWAPWRERFLQDEVLPRVPADALALIDHHRARGDTLVLTTATNRVITELTASALGLPHLIATEAALADGLYTGHTDGVLNMREGKVTRLRAWLAPRGWRCRRRPPRWPLPISTAIRPMTCPCCVRWGIRWRWTPMTGCWPRPRPSAGR